MATATSCMATAASACLVALGLTATFSDPGGFAPPDPPTPSLAGPPQAAAATATSDFPGPRDVENFRRNIEPVLTRDRGGSLPGYAACVMCHTWQTSLRFRLEIPATDAGWTPDQSRRNLQMLTKLVNTSSVEKSRLLLKPLDPVVGGLVHTGGTYWTSREDAEYQMVLKWIRSLPAGRYGAPPEVPIDFEFFRSCVQKVFQNPRDGHIKCSNCHASDLMGFAPVPADGRNDWNELEARAAFQVAMRLVIPGNPEESRFLLKPLHPDGGGSYAHNGPRRWQSRDDPEWQMLASWVRGERKGSSCQ
jgi:hypothetical protein